ncbi:MAG: phosphoribosylamine--glycine ligase [Kiritimatiellae bacterium]|jgi:phosphoribosylamine--glycine ligase|nr:phosphoribosylamine--glycine ligase [Kiritimatiellia bacterium]
MKILVVGNGGREHALTWKLSTDSAAPEMFCAPGNAGTKQIATNLPIQADDIDGLVKWAKENQPDLTVVGPEVPLCLGLTDKLEALGQKVFGPSKAAAQMEGSKVFSKEIMEAAGIPTAASKSFTSPDEALKYAENAKIPCVVKAEGLAAGKGVIICETRAELLDAIKVTMLDKAFGDAGNRMLIEDFLKGEEASILALIDGENILMLASSQDHKRIFDDDKGPNTGGMGAYSPAPIVTDDLWPIIKKDVFQKTLDELKKRGITYKGVLYAGLMIEKKVPFVLEFNCRFGDPETQVVLPRIEGDLLPAFMACAEGNKLTDDILKWKDEHAVCVVMASGGYPGSYQKGKVIEGIEQAENEKSIVFQAGTKNINEQIVTNGGRVLVVSSLGKDLPDAIKNAYSSIKNINFDGAFYRKDIGAKGLKYTN